MLGYGEWCPKCNWTGEAEEKHLCSGEKVVEEVKKKVKCKLSSGDGNAYAVMNRVVEALKKAGAESAVVIKYTKDATSGDYQSLLHCSMNVLDEHGIEWS